MDRRAFITLLTSTVGLATPTLADRKRPKIGLLDWFPPTMRVDLDHFREGMQQFGYVEGNDYEIEVYFTSGDRQLTEETARKLVREPVDVLVAVTSPAARVAAEATDTIPIVMLTASALATDLSPSLSRPSRNLTGVSLLMTDVAGKRSGLLRQMNVHLKAVAFLGSTNDPYNAAFVRETKLAADNLGIALSVRTIDGPSALDQDVFDAMKRDGNEAVIVEPIFTGNQDKIVSMAMTAKLPVVADFSVFADAGALMTYGPNQAASLRRAAYFVNRILKGARPVDLPIEQPTAFELVINRRTAVQLGWTIPQGVMVLADRVIE